MKNYLNFLFFGFSFFQLVNSFQCPPGSYEIPNEDVCVFFEEEHLFYVDVIHRCVELGGRPVKIENIYENAFIFAMLDSVVQGGLTAYIGIERKSNHTWTYDDGSALVYNIFQSNI